MQTSIEQEQESYGAKAKVFRSSAHHLSYNMWYEGLALM